MNKPIFFIRRLALLSIVFLAISCISGCAISYKFNGATIDYSKIKTIHIADITNQAPLVYAPLAAKITEALKDMYTRRTKLELTRNEGDLNISGEIVGYDLTPEAIQENALAARTKFTMTIMIHFRNNVQPNQNFDKTFTAYTDFDSSKLFSDVQDALCEELYENINKQIFNATVENW